MKNLILTLALSMSMSAMAADDITLATAAPTTAPAVNAIDAVAVNKLVGEQVKYPRIAKARGWEGTVMVRAWNENGAALAAVTESSKVASLDKAALEAVQETLKANPTLIGTGQSALIPVIFQIK